jgi:Cft2 family RNA processing exonuclease
MLQEDNRMLIFGKMVDINLEIDQFSFSNHADHPLLVSFAQEVSADDTILFHGDRNDAQPALSTALSELGMRVHMPENGQSYLLS